MRPANSRALSSVERNTTLRSLTLTIPGAPRLTRTEPKAFSTSSCGELPVTGRSAAASKLHDGP